MCWSFFGVFGFPRQEHQTARRIYREWNISCSAVTTKTPSLILMCAIQPHQPGSFSIYHLLPFLSSGQRYCVDATKESDKLGRLINHSRLHPNCAVKVIPIDGVPRLALFAKTEIPPGIFLAYQTVLMKECNSVSTQTHECVSRVFA